MSPLQNLYLFASLYLNVFLWLLLLFGQLNIHWLSSMKLHSRQDLQSVHLLLLSTSERPSTRLDNELDINLKLSMNFIFYVITLPFTIYWYWKIYIFIFRFFWQLLDYKMIVIFRTIMKYYRNFFWCFVS